MTLDADEFVRRFLIHVLPDGFHRIRHYGLFANANRADNIARVRQLLSIPEPQTAPSDVDSIGEGEPQASSHPCPCCGGRMIIIEIFERGCSPRYHPTVPNRVDSSCSLSPDHEPPMLLQLLPLVCRRRACSTNDHDCAPAHSRGNGNRNSLTASPRPATTLSHNPPHLAVTIPTSQPIARGSQIPIAPSRHAVLPPPTRGFLPRGFSDTCLRASPRAGG